MIRCLRRIGWTLPAAALCVAALGCSGSSPTQPPSGGPTPQPTPTASPTPVPAPTPIPGPTPTPGAVCPLGKGDVDAFCSRRSGMFLTDVEAAIDKLVAERPQLFDLNDSASPGGYRVLDAEEYLAGVMANLQAKGFCAALLGEQLQLKLTNDLSEEYDILLASSHIRRGAGSYLKTCTPAAFPLEPEDVIKRLPIFMYSLTCPDRVPDRPYNREIPVGCTGLLTATPKDKNDHDVDPRIHGPECQWSVRTGEDLVRLEEFHEVPFNVKVVGRDPGDFTLCAVIIHGIEGCFEGRVVP